MSCFRLLPLALFLGSWSARAYVLNYSETFKAKHWELLVPQYFVSTNSVNTNTHAIRYYLASDGWSATNTAAELNAVRASLGQWLAVSNTFYKFEEAGLVNPPVDVNLNDHSNIIYWTKSSTLVNGGNDNISGASGVAFTTWDTVNNIILEADIVFNGTTEAISGCANTRVWITDFSNTSTVCGVTFVEGVAAHEIGHFLGLAHSPLGGATMFFRGASGVNSQAGLSDDDIAGGRMLYPISRTNFGAIKGTVTKSGSPVFGAEVFVLNSVSNIVAGTVTLPNGTYEVNMLRPANYLLRVAPLDPLTGTRLCAGYDISFGGNGTNSDFSTGDTSFLPTTNVAVTVTANATNTVNVTVSNSTPPYRVTRIRQPTTNPGSFSWSSNPALLRPGQSNYIIGVAAANLPSNSVTLTITGDGLTLGAVTPDLNLGGYNTWSMPISVSSNATPGLRDFIFIYQGTNIDYANGFVEILPTVSDYNFDGFDDLFQRQYFSPWTSANAAQGADPDGDGMNNTAEYLAGTVPTNAASVLKMQSVARTNTTNTVRWQSVSGKKYQLSYRTNVASGSWSNLGSVVTASGATALQTDTTATNILRAYRVQIVP